VSPNKQISERAPTINVFWVGRIGASLIRSVMRNEPESDAREVSRWSLWLVAIVCFGPLALIVLLGVFALPLWFGMAAAYVGEPERLSHELPGSLRDVVWPIALVVSGLIGLAGLLRVLTISRRSRPKSTRVVTIGMIAVGLVALAIFDFGLLVGVGSDLSAGIPVEGIAVYLVLPFAGAYWLVSKSWRFLVADRQS
jgi:hypothetical protein